MIDIAVFAPLAQLTVTVEDAPGSTGDEIHLHPGGQGFWVARMIHELGRAVGLCCPVGGEPGAVVRTLLASWGVEDRTVTTTTATACYLHDRRSGQRRPVAGTAGAPLDRHGLDDLYSATLASALEAGVCVVTGRPTPDVVPVDVYRRLGADLDAMGVRAVGDLHGDELHAFLDGGPLAVLKVSDEDLRSDGAETTDDDLWARADQLAGRGVDAVVVSRASRATMAAVAGRRYLVTGPRLSVVEHRGAGDSMTAGLAVATHEGADPGRLLRLASGAAAANVVRRGLGSADATLIDALLRRIEVTELP